MSKGGDGSALVVVLLLVLVGHAGAQNCTDLSGTIRGGMCDGTQWAMQACVPLNNTQEQYAQILSGLAANDLSVEGAKALAPALCDSGSLTQVLAFFPHFLLHMHNLAPSWLESSVCPCPQASDSAFMLYAGGSQLE